MFTDNELPGRVCAASQVGRQTDRIITGLQRPEIPHFFYFLSEHLIYCFLSRWSVNLIKYEKKRVLKRMSYPSFQVSHIASETTQPSAAVPWQPPLFSTQIQLNIQLAVSIPSSIRQPIIGLWFRRCAPLGAPVSRAGVVGTVVSRHVLVVDVLMHHIHYQVKRSQRKHSVIWIKLN